MSTATPPRPQPVERLLWSVLLGWCIPGLGHFMNGLRRQGALLFLLVCGLFLCGYLLSDREAVSRQLHPWAFWAQVGFGGGTLPLVYFDPARQHLLRGHDTITDYQTVPRFSDTGLLFCSVAGLLNMLILFDLADRLVGRRPQPVLKKEPA